MYPERMQREPRRVVRPRVQPAGAARAGRVGHDARRRVPHRAAQRDDARGSRADRSSTCCATIPRSSARSATNGSTRASTSSAALANVGRTLRRPRRAPSGRREQLVAAAPLLGQGARALRGRPRPHARGRVRPHLGVRRRARPTSSPTRAECSPRCRRSGSSRPRTSSPNHLVSSDPTDFPETAGADVAGRAMLVRAARPVRLECVARGYLFGSAWSDYEETGTVSWGARSRRACARPSGCRSRSSRPPPRPTSGHDLPLTDADAAALVGGDRYEQLRDLTLAVYAFGAELRSDARADPRRHQARVRRRSTASWS